MEKGSPQSRREQNYDDILEGLFVSPEENAASLQKLEEKESKILTISQPPQGLHTASRGVPLEDKWQATRQIHSDYDQAILRFSRELASIKQDLLALKEHFEAIKELQMPAPSPSVPNRTPKGMPRAPKEVSAGSFESSDQNYFLANKELLSEIKKLLLYLDRLLESLPEERIEEFARSEYFNLYRHVFDELGLS